ncbi:ferric uptake regulator family protein [Burkholderia pseudomallei MSHR4032]|uniref:ferric iron uptake transcriptional regulator n=1 Tax=Burkholderia pseudomallei TaxID=28450 RepID=UPI00050E07EE|nr:ferric iron uptake transcriptional regulator [Burkholderia pseudomallei]KGD40672.1 ferric uptake regulator family protein [Burkholderia pseudomallei]KGU89962.1 ferric uptake regulator family protein [Burkholderia pseudomallei MSHR4032]MBM5585448.1 ferric iron uptake transcriptional regulator [Burkholderia pseudomallei]RPA01177.1 ferric iron uptake transcriptional regulator [Burkholderia pseudomallei]
MPDSAELKSRGVKATLPRLQILELFQQADVRHLSAEEVYRLMFERGYEIGLATVYRVLMQLEQAGLLKQAHFALGRAIYELDDGTHHDHLVCTTCGRVQEFHDDLIERQQAAVARQHGFEVIEHSHILYGRCTKSPCEDRRATDPDPRNSPVQK